MPKIYLSPAYHRMNPCALNGCDETTHNNMYLDELEPFLRACGIEYKRGTRRVPMSSEDGTQLMYKAVAESNAWGADLHYISHTNAANGSAKGYRPIIYKGSEKGRRFADYMMFYRREIYGGDIVLNERTDLYELKATNALAYYEEHVFHDNAEDAQWFHDNLRLIAKQTARGFCDYFGISFINPYVTEEPKVDPIPEPTQPTGGNDKIPETEPKHKYTVADALKALQAAVGKVELPEDESKRLDFNGDGKVTASDAIDIMQEATGKK